MVRTLPERAGQVQSGVDGRRCVLGGALLSPRIIVVEPCQVLLRFFRSRASGWRLEEFLLCIVQGTKFFISTGNLHMAMFL